MLSIVVPKNEVFNNETNEFIKVKKQTLHLEHSLVSMSKWESKWHKPFITKNEKTFEETIDYIKCMTITQNVDDNVYYALTPENLQQINDYIEDPMTATTISESPNSRKGRNNILTSEVIYSAMIALNIPVEFQKWHLNRLLTLIKVCESNNTPAKKMSKSEILKRNKALNEARKAKYHTKG